jgi:quercetin dioxygenase-like cupin family protein
LSTKAIEHVYLASGKLRITLGKDAAELEAGDVCSCFADEPHSFDNRDGKLPAELIIVVEPPRGPERPARHSRSG